jgi:UDP-N-acetylmuramoyl-tripeptide--D-alanyl-D-alanine ligase
MIAELYELYRQHPAVCTDTRQLTPGCLFFALKGDNFDANRFAAAALAGGAAYAVVDDPAAPAGPHRDRFFLVPDVLAALQQLAAHHRRHFDIPVIAIGGSNGKTTTKELVAAVLSSYHRCHATTGNLNNHIGVPLTLLAMPDTTEVAVIEMGANRAGDIEQLCALAAPTHGLITNIGKEHLEGFGSLEGVKKAEGELYRYLARQRGCVFLNLTEKYLRSMARRNVCRILYSEQAVRPGDDSRVISVELLAETPFVRVAFLDENHQPVTVQTKLFGRHNFQNIMTAIALGLYFKVPGARIQQALEAYTPSNNRSQLVHQGSNTIVLDAYNANPSSMDAALESLKALPGQHKVAILGDMLELGEESQREHAALLRRAARCRFDRLVLVGPEFGRCEPARYNALHFPDARAAKDWLARQSFEDTLLLIKGSRGIRLEQLVS